MKSLPIIPIQNIYYLLAYAWDYFREGHQVDVSSDDCPNSINLLAHLLAKGITGLSRRGIDKNYALVDEETPRLRGRLDMVGSYRRGLQFTGRLRCEYDELTADTLANQILKTTCRRLRQASSQLTTPNLAAVHKAHALLSGISEIDLTRRTFHHVQLHRNNRHYRFLINICELLNSCFLPAQHAGPTHFRDVLEDEMQMHALFERFVLHFARRHCVGARVRSMAIQWVGSWGQEVDAVLPRMLSDVAIEYPGHKTVLDCKFYREALRSRHGGERLHSSHLYQLNAYLQNQSHQVGWENVRGVLLYPAVSHHLKLRFRLLENDVEIHSLDLDQPWLVIHEQLLRIVVPPGI